jgi:hypothetical protein
MSRIRTHNFSGDRHRLHSQLKIQLPYDHDHEAPIYCTRQQIIHYTENCENRNDPDLVQAFLKKWWVESDFKAPNLPLSLRLKDSSDNNTLYPERILYTIEKSQE